MGHAPDEPMRCMVGPVAATFPAQSSAFSKLLDCGSPDWEILSKRSFPECPGALGREFFCWGGALRVEVGSTAPGAKAVAAAAMAERRKTRVNISVGEESVGDDKIHVIV